MSESLLQITEFAIELFSYCENLSGNTLISPFSIYIVLFMILYGSRELTQTQIQRALRSKSNALSADIIKFEEYSAITAFYRRPNIQECIKLLTFLFYKDSLQINKKLLEQSKILYMAESFPFKLNSNLGEKIVQMVKERLGPTIVNIKKDFPPDTNFVIYNVLTFKGLWTQPFTEVFEDYFENYDGTKVTTKYLKQKGKCEISLLPDYGFIVFLSYRNNDLVMSLFLPRLEFYKDNQKSFAHILKVMNIKHFLKPLRSLSISLSIPRFSLSPETDLKKPLQSMGVVDAFAHGTADFRGFTENGAKGQDIAIDQFIHKVSLDLDDKGPRSPVSGIAGNTVKKVRSVGPTKIIFDRPFMFMIFERAQKIPLFMGSINKL